MSEEVPSPPDEANLFSPEFALASIPKIRYNQTHRLYNNIYITYRSYIWNMSLIYYII